MGKVFFPSRERSKKVKSTKTANGYTKTFSKSLRTLMKGMEVRPLCDVTVALSIAAFLR